MAKWCEFWSFKTHSSSTVGFPHAICTIPKSSPFLFGAVNIQAIHGCAGYLPGHHGRCSMIFDDIRWCSNIQFPSINHGCLYFSNISPNQHMGCSIIFPEKPMGSQSCCKPSPNGRVNLPQQAQAWPRLAVAARERSFPAASANSRTGNPLV